MLSVKIVASRLAREIESLVPLSNRKNGINQRGNGSHAGPGDMDPTLKRQVSRSAVHV